MCLGERETTPHSSRPRLSCPLQCCPSFFFFANTSDYGLLATVPVKTKSLYETLTGEFSPVLGRLLIVQASIDKMYRMRNDRSRAESSHHSRRRSKDDEEIIKVPDFDFTDLIEKHKLSLVGRMFHQDGRSVEALLKHMPRRRIWDVEGRVRGINLGNNKFQFDFDKEEDLQKVLLRRPCHFNKWSFSLERWIPTIKEDYPNFLILWVTVTGVPTHYKKDESYRSIGQALGEVDTVDVDNGRVRVKINADEPLQFERKAGYANGDVISVTLKYEELHRFCYTCKRISHEEGTCPDLSPTQREVNRIARLEQKEKEELAAREAFSAPTRGYESHVRFDPQTRNPRDHDLDRKTVDSHWRRSDRAKPEYTRKTEYDDLRLRISNKRDDLAKTVWKRLEHNGAGKIPRDRERYHPYQKDADPRYTKRISESLNKQGRYGDSASSSSWRVKGVSSPKRNRDIDVLHEKRRYDPPMRSFRSPDSQRTISEPYRAHRNELPERRNVHQSRVKPRLEWQPVRVTERRKDVQDQALAERESEQGRESEEARRWRLKGKAIDVSSDGNQDNLESGRVASGALKINETATRNLPENLPENQAILEKNMSNTEPQGKRTAEQKTSRTAAPGPTEGRENQEPENVMTKIIQAGGKMMAKETELLSEEEINQITEQYASVDFEMDEDMLNDDDLLDETEDEVLFVPETQEVINQANPIQKSDDKDVRGDVRGDRQGTEKTRKTGLDTNQAPEKNRKAQKDMLPPTSINKRRGTRSPDRKGTAASKKLAVRGRNSPKGKLVKHGRPSSLRASGMTSVPRTEVYPSAVRGRKSVAASGSVGSQKPPSTQI